LPEGDGEEGLANARRAKDHDVAMILDEAKRDQFVEHTTVVGHLGGLVPAFEHHVWVEPGLVGAPDGGVAVAPGD